jgi:hypothetical protein
VASYGEKEKKNSNNRRKKKAATTAVKPYIQTFSQTTFIFLLKATKNQLE